MWARGRVAGREGAGSTRGAGLLFPAWPRAAFPPADAVGFCGPPGAPVRQRRSVSEFNGPLPASFLGRDALGTIADGRPRGPARFVRSGSSRGRAGRGVASVLNSSVSDNSHVESRESTGLEIRGNSNAGLFFLRTTSFPASL